MITINKKNGGFVLLFSVMLSSIIFAVSLGVANIALKEIKFGTSTIDTNNAFLAADMGAECALFNDRSDANSFVQNGGTGKVQCLNPSGIALSGTFPVWSFIMSGLGYEERGCAKITLDKTNSLIKLVSKGYNVGGEIPGLCAPGPNSVERVLELNY